MNLNCDSNTRYLLFMDSMRGRILELYDHIFSGQEDPEVQWAIFRRELSKLKKEQIELWLNIDDD